MQRDYFVPKWVPLILAAIAIAITMLGWAMGRTDQGFLSGISVSVIAFAAFARRDLRNDPSYWVLIAAWLTIHYIAIGQVIGLLGNYPAIAITPFFFFDYVLVLGSFFLLSHLKSSG